MSDAKAEAEAIQRYGDEQYAEGLQDGWTQAILKLEELADAPAIVAGATHNEVMAGMRAAIVMMATAMRAQGPEERRDARD